MEWQCIKLNPKYFGQKYTFFRQVYQECLKQNIQFINLYIHTHQLYLLKQHSESYNIWSAIMRINTEDKTLIVKFGPDVHAVGLYFAIRVFFLFLMVVFELNFTDHKKHISKSGNTILIQLSKHYITQFFPSLALELRETIARPSP